MKGEFVKKILDEKGISQAQVAKKLGVSPQLLSHPYVAIVEELKQNEMQKFNK